MHVTSAQGPQFARFMHESGISLRLQAALVVRDGDRRVACVRLRDYPDGWRLPVENMHLNESPTDAAARVAGLWFESPLAPRLVDVISYPPMGGDDKAWYLLFLFEADAPADLKVTPDTDELKFVPIGTPPGPFGAAHADVFNELKA